jgi:vitamin B12/bleomycin/antimicrobial peptide transport system ATP-binding/permease protein
LSIFGLTRARLSGGEKQRLAFARIVLQDPDIIVLDEATAALDAQSQNRLMELLVREPDHTTLISVGHRPELELFHTRKIVLERRSSGTRLVSDIHLEKSHSRGLIRRWLKRSKKVEPHDVAERCAAMKTRILKSPTLAPK